MAYAKTCGADPAEWEARWRSPAEDLDRPDPAQTPGETPPYVGVRSSGPEDADRFFGRERSLEKVTAQLRRDRIIAVLGASGSGKSSLLRAGLVATADHPAGVGPVLSRPPLPAAVPLMAGRARKMSRDRRDLDGRSPG
ncbi:hypothetical protein GCM10009733_057760 [Nonomuraea maheshkhaliensis]|uniref:Novel STAND NTPase 1 domain-containing protein n=2 Tax=Nonomuraea maheshkhaliensis TaxID=419590 RepID=A0ABN2FLV6_9ACTN